MKEIVLITCPKKFRPCRHCSDEIEKITTRTGDIVTGIRRTERVTPLGAFCNNDGQHFVKDLEVCPRDLALAVSLVPHVISELEWMRRKTG